MKKLIFLIFALMTFMCISASAETVGGDCGYYGGPNVKWSYDSETKTLSFIGQGIMADYYSIGATPWYPYRRQIEKVFVGDGVTTLGINALGFMDALDELRLPSTLTEIRGRYPLGSCKPLRELTIPAGLTDPSNFLNTVSHIWGHSTIINADENSQIFSSEDGVLYSKDKTVLIYCPAEIAGESFTVRDSVKEIAEMAFYYCKELKRVDLPDGLTSIGSAAFRGCSSLKEIVLPDSLTTIGSSAFCGCSSFEEIVLPDSLTTIGSDAFWFCTSLKHARIPEGVIRLSSSTFSHCSALETVVLPDSLLYIETGAFSDCTSLKEIRIPDKVFYMGNAIFSGCTSLRSVVFPANLDNVSRDFMFKGCHDLIIYAPSGSLSERYAREFAHNEGITFVAI